MKKKITIFTVNILDNQFLDDIKQKICIKSWSKFKKFDIDNIKLPTEPTICHLNGDVDQNKRCDLCSGSNIYRD